MANYSANPFVKYIIKGVQPSFLLFFAAFFAIIIANTDWFSWYESLLSRPIVFQIDNFNLFSHKGHAMSFLAFVNDALMAVFFFVVGLEIKREILVGELSSFKKALLPIWAAVGGMIFPILCYLMIANTHPEIKGAAIPMATDIAFALGVLALLGKKVPFSLKIFLTSLAVVDDLGGILVMAVFYSEEIMFTPLFISFVILLFLYLGGKLHIWPRFIYYFFGIVVWILFLRSGVHAAISGVLLAMTVPAKSKYSLNYLLDNVHLYLKKIPKDVFESTHATILNRRQRHIVGNIGNAAYLTVSPLQSMLSNLEPVVYYLILPLFAFVNSGIVFKGIQFSELMGVPLAIFVGLFFGKTIGIFLMSFLGHKLKIITLPPSINYKVLLGISLLGGVGFTVSLFIANLAFGSIPDIGANLLNQAKIGVFVGSVLSGTLGYLLLRKHFKKGLKTKIHKV